MSQLKKNLALLSVLFIVSACGLKGDLYLPEAEPQVVNSASQEIENISNQESEIEATLEDITPDSAQPK